MKLRDITFFKIFAHYVKFQSNMIKKVLSNGTSKGLRVKKDPEWFNKVNPQLL